MEPALWILRAVVEYTRLLVDVLNLQRLEFTTTTELYVLQSFDVDDKTVRLCLSDGLLKLQVGDLKHITKSNDA